MAIYQKIVIACTITNLIVILIGLLAKFVLPPQIPIFFGFPQTEEQLASSLFIVIPPIISLFFITLNSIFTIKMESSYIKKSLAFASLAVTLLSTIAVIKIIFLVGSI